MERNIRFRIDNNLRTDNNNRRQTCAANSAQPRPKPRPVQLISNFCVGHLGKWPSDRFRVIVRNCAIDREDSSVVVWPFSFVVGYHLNGFDLYIPQMCLTFEETAGNGR